MRNGGEAVDAADAADAFGGLDDKFAKSENR